MSKKEKSTILYSRNGIKIEKIEFLDMTKWSNKCDVGRFIISTFVSSTKKKSNKTKVIAAKKAWTETLKFESPLGFYWYHTIEHPATKQQVIEDNLAVATYKKLVFKFDDKRYELTYPIKCGDNSLSITTRPWDLLPGYTGIEDHFINDLYKEVVKFFEVAEINRIALQIKPASWGKSEELSNDMSWVETTMKQTLKDLFGDEKGPMINYNDIKILSHGFDLKESFRKRKEN